MVMPSTLTRIAHGIHNQGSVVPFHMILASVKCMLGYRKNLNKKTYSHAIISSILFGKLRIFDLFGSLWLQATRKSCLDF